MQKQQNYIPGEIIVNNDGIYKVTQCLNNNVCTAELIISKEVFIMAYNAWIKEEKYDKRESN